MLLNVVCTQRQEYDYSLGASARSGLAALQQRGWVGAEKGLEEALELAVLACDEDTALAGWLEGYDFYFGTNAFSPAGIAGDNTFVVELGPLFEALGATKWGVRALLALRVSE